MGRIILIVLLFLIITSPSSGQSTEVTHWESIFNADELFRYWDSNSGELDSNWRVVNFNDILWLEGKGGIGYGDNDDGTIINTCNSVALRYTFTVADKSKLTGAWLYVDYDDAFVAYLNNKEIARSEGLTDAFPSLSALSTTQHEAGKRVGFNIPYTQLNDFLLNGENVFALQVHNASVSSTDLSSSAWLIVNNSATDTSYQTAPEWFDETFLSFTTSNIPIILLETENQQTIPDEPKILAHMSIINNSSGINSIIDTPNEYNGSIGIELRGNSTQAFPKKPYNLETRDEEGENLNVPLFGWPQENDWVLRASYLDHTFIRNGLADYLSRLNGWWASRTQLVEVVLNGEYQGIYIFMEDIKPDKGRLDIATLNPDEITEPDISGGYIWEITGFDSKLGKSRKLKYPSFDEAAPEQIAYIKNYDDQFRDLMLSDFYGDSISGYASCINTESFVNEILVQESLRNSDAYGWSGYFHKDKNEKINAGPVWDFDQSSGNSSYPDNGVVEGWMFDHKNTDNTPFFWSILFNDPAFSFAVRSRWESLRQNVYSTENLFTYIDSIASLLSEAQKREFTKWDVLGTNIWRATTGFKQRDTYQKEIDYLKDFLSQRWTWMDNELKKYEDPYLNTQSLQTTLADQSVLVYPNPARKLLYIKVSNTNVETLSITICNSIGAVVYHEQFFNKNLIALQLSENYHPGMYIYKIQIDKEQELVGRFIKIE